MAWKGAPWILSLQPPWILAWKGAPWILSLQPVITCLASCCRASRVHGHLQLATVAANRFFELEPDNAGKYVVLSNVYAARGLWRKVGEVREVMKENGRKKEPACSWIERFLSPVSAILRIGRRRFPPYSGRRIQIHYLWSDHPQIWWRGLYGCHGSNGTGISLIQRSDRRNTDWSGGIAGQKLLRLSKVVTRSILGRSSRFHLLWKDLFERNLWTPKAPKVNHD
ncbi:Pentatricopeptide repeat-containing protein [Nymphaea thermarum]|nr:Pentatricopeptide repeat-containing protein [Nymphaea thermarum]